MQFTNFSNLVITMIAMGFILTLFAGFMKYLWPEFVKLFPAITKLIVSSSKGIVGLIKVLLSKKKDLAPMNVGTTITARMSGLPGRSFTVEGGRLTYQDDKDKSISVEDCYLSLSARAKYRDLSGRSFAVLKGRIFFSDGTGVEVDEDLLKRRLSEKVRLTDFSGRKFAVRKGRIIYQDGKELNLDENKIEQQLSKLLSVGNASKFHTPFKLIQSLKEFKIVPQQGLGATPVTVTTSPLGIEYHPPKLTWDKVIKLPQE